MINVHIIYDDLIFDMQADEMFAVMECRWGQAIRDSLDCLLDAVVDKFNASTDTDPTVTNVCVTRDE
jgi:hypothetical protein